MLLGRPRPDPCNDSACGRVFAEVTGEVAARLRNTPAVCRKSYINPLLLQAWQQGAAPFDRMRPRRRGAAALLSLLRSAGGAAVRQRAVRRR
jgi:DNA topoisomerase IB